MPQKQPENMLGWGILMDAITCLPSQTQPQPHYGMQVFYYEWLFQLPFAFFWLILVKFFSFFFFKLYSVLNYYA